MRRIVSCLIALTFAACINTPALPGTDLGDGAAPNFTLQDGVTGRSLTLSDFRGKVVILTFLYTNCPDSCPLTAETLRSTQERLGAEATRVELVAVSVDPAGDTPQSVRAFTDAHRLTSSWHYLIGRREQLEPVWTAYGLRTEPDRATPTITHTDAIFLIDSRGKERRLLHTDVGPDALATAVRDLLK